VSPSEFRDYWGVSNEEIALLTGWSLDSVNHWFANGNSKRAVPPSGTVLLATIHTLWLSWEAASDLPPQIEEIYRLVKERRERL